MKLYLTSIDIPVPAELAKLLGKPLSETSVALIPNAQDYFAPRAWDFKAAQRIEEFGALGLHTTTVNLRDYSDPARLKQELEKYDLIWARGGNTYCLRYEMQRSGFDAIIGDLVAGGIVYGGDSAGALAAGISIAGIESADNPAFAPAVVEAGLNLVPHVILPHVGNPEFAGAITSVQNMPHKPGELIQITDAQAVIFDGSAHHIVTGPSPA